jgi:digeranylgeranylglycerophospholipid reductase
MINIIGAGPIGSYCAYLLSRSGKKVNVFEEHKDIGLPIQCTGITTSLLKKIIRLNKDIIINEISKVRIFSPNGNHIEINFKEKNLVIDRKKFDEYIADMAQKEGAKFFLNHRFIDNDDYIARIKDKKTNQTKKVKFDKLIGADGPLSQVARSNDLFIKRKFWQGVQARVKIKNKNIIEFYPYFGTYAWLVPENKNTARVGLVSKYHANTLFKNFLKFKKIKKEDIIEYQGGLIPMYNPKIRTKKGFIYIVGDAASHVKATTGGGIIQGLLAAESLSYSIIKHKNYEKQWRKKIGRELYLHLMARNIMDKFKAKDWNKLIKIINSKECKKILENNNRDNIYSILIRLIIKEPRLLLFIKRLIF